MKANLIATEQTQPLPVGNERKPGEILVFCVHTDTKCAECGEELPRGRMATFGERGALCLACADLDHLEFLPRGDAALTRRATKHSRLKAVVLQWSRTRKRSERQGLLVQSDALTRAESECLRDAAQRERQREQRGMREAQFDRKFVREFAEHIRQQYPGCPANEAKQIAEHACRKYSGRVGRTAAAKEFAPEAIRLAITAAVRHQHTYYDELLMRGYDPHEARALVSPAVAEQLANWR